MTQYLPPNLLALFAPRDPIQFMPQLQKLPYEKKTRGYSGIAQYLSSFEDPKDTPPPMRIETREERHERRKREKAEKVAYKLEQGIALWDPNCSSTATLDPFRTLFVARINYDTSDAKLRREFESYGTIRKVQIVSDRVSGKPRGYAFIEYESERDMHAAYKYADGKKIDGRRVLVDVERGRTVKGWLPRRLGGGLGGTRRGGPEMNTKHSGREDNRYEEERDRGDRNDRHRDGITREKERHRDYRDRDREHRRNDRKRSRSRDREKERRSRRSRSPRDRGDRVDRIDRSERLDRKRVDSSQSPTRTNLYHHV